MSYGFLDIAITPAVRAAQQQMGADEIWTDFTGHRDFDRFSPQETAFIEQRDSFYIATVSETGWPYIQHRGGPRGFLRLLDEKTLAFADYRGNRQYISTGNLGADNRACLILMDYPNRARMKIYARVSVVALDEDPALAARLVMEGYKAKPERIFVLHLETFDWNCAQHITPRFTEEEIDQALQPIRRKRQALETENAALKAQLRRHKEAMASSHLDQQ